MSESAPKRPTLNSAVACKVVWVEDERSYTTARTTSRTTRAMTAALTARESIVLSKRSRQCSCPQPPPTPKTPSMSALAVWTESESVDDTDSVSSECSSDTRSFVRSAALTCIESLVPLALLQP